MPRTALATGFSRLPQRSEQGATHRIVYRLLPSGDGSALVQVFAAGAEHGPSGGVYARVAERCGPMLADEAD